LKKKTHEEFIKEVFNLVEEEYEVLGEYTGSKNKISMKHNLCGNIWNIIPNSFLSNRRCPICGIKERNKKETKTHKQFLQEVYNFVGDEYLVLEQYINSHTKILMKHNICNYQWLNSPDNFLKGCRCPKCAGVLPYTTETFKEKVFELEGKEYDVLSEYKNTQTKILMIHNGCGKEYYVKPNKFINGRRCPICSQEQVKIKITKTHEQFCKEVYNLCNDEYLILNKYINSSKKVLMKHNICGYEWEVNPGNFLNNNSRCPACNESKGERKIRYWLLNNNIYFEPQHTFNDLKGLNNGLLKFDFAILEIDNKLKCLIEYDGIFHYKKQYDEDGFEALKYHDQFKNVYCKKNNISLLRIPYWEFNNIENILTNYLN
jgi:hypothetical protein